jgi:hypothetical protein
VTAPPAGPGPAAKPPAPKPTTAQRVVGLAFLGAFGLTILTVVLTGLNVQSPRARRTLEAPSVELTVGEPRTINLVFKARAALADVELTVDLPPGIELATHPGDSRVISRTPLAAGDNALPLMLVARAGSGGQLAARLRAGDDRKVFVVDVRVQQP